MEPKLTLETLPDFLTVDEAAMLLRISRAGAYEAIRRNELPSVRIGRRILVPASRLKEMLFEGGTRDHQEGEAVVRRY